MDTLRENNAMVNTKYKTVEKTVKPATRPQPTNSKRKRKEVSEDPSLHNSVDIGHTFMEESGRKLRIGVKEFLLPEEKNRLWEMLKGHGKAFAF